MMNATANNEKPNETQSSHAVNAAIPCDDDDLTNLHHIPTTWSQEDHHHTGSLLDNPDGGYHEEEKGSNDMSGPKFQPGDHVIRWQILKVMVWPIQVHGIVLGVEETTATNEEDQDENSSSSSESSDNSNNSSSESSGSSISRGTDSTEKTNNGKCPTPTYKVTIADFGYTSSQQQQQQQQHQEPMESGTTHRGGRGGGLGVLNNKNVLRRFNKMNQNINDMMKSFYKTKQQADVHQESTFQSSSSSIGGCHQDRDGYFDRIPSRDNDDDISIDKDDDDDDNDDVSIGEDSSSSSSSSSPTDANLNLSTSSSRSTDDDDIHNNTNDINRQPKTNFQQDPHFRMDDTNDYDEDGDNKEKRPRFQVIEISDPEILKKWHKVDYGKSLFKKNYKFKENMAKSGRKLMTSLKLDKLDLGTKLNFRRKMKNNNSHSHSGNYATLARDQNDSKITSESTSINDDTPKLPKSDPRKIVLARTQYILDQQDLPESEQTLPPYHILYSNSECLAVWCKTGKFSTLQAAVFLHSTAVGNAKSTFLMTGAVVATQPWLIPVVGIYGAVAIGMPYLLLKKCKENWSNSELKLTDGFWSNADPEVFVTAIEHWSDIDTDKKKEEDFSLNGSKQPSNAEVELFV